MSDVLRFIGVNKDTTTAGPGKRLEFFTKGCIRGVISPCVGCFNEATWTFEGNYREFSVDEVVQICKDTAWNRQVTFCGGEPILQARAITKVAKRLKVEDPSFHFVLYTAYKLDTLMKYGLKFTWTPKYGDAMYDALVDYSDYYFDPRMSSSDAVDFHLARADQIKELMKYVDIIVDGDYQQDKRLTTDTYMHEGWFVGSSNQRVINGPHSIQEGKLIFKHADAYNEQRQKDIHCECCGHITHKRFCCDLCEIRYKARQKELSKMGGV